VAQAKFVHTVSAGYVTGSMFVLSISAFDLRRRYRGLAIRSLTVAVSFGLASALSMPRVPASSSQHQPVDLIESRVCLCSWHPGLLAPADGQATPSLASKLTPTGLWLWQADRGTSASKRPRPVGTGWAAPRRYHLVVCGATMYVNPK
jgi:Cytochrome bd terminal oxidase subunit I